MTNHQTMQMGHSMGFQMDIIEQIMISYADIRYHKVPTFQMDTEHEPEHLPVAPGPARPGQVVD